MRARRGRFRSIVGGVETGEGPSAGAEGRTFSWCRRTSISSLLARGTWRSRYAAMALFAFLIVRGLGWIFRRGSPETVVEPLCKAAPPQTETPDVQPIPSMKVRTRRQASSQAFRNCSAERSKKECGAPS